jgi:alpha-beta hydrolase superfamily lysophospholipase
MSSRSAIAQVTLSVALFIALLLLSACHSEVRAVRRNPRVEPFDYQITVGQDQYHIEGYIGRSLQPGREPALLVINPAEDAVRCMQSSMQLTRLGMHVACISLPGVGKSSGPGRFVGPQAVAAARRAIDLLSERADVDPARLGVWGLANGAVAAGLLMDADPRPRVVILQSGAYDMTRYWPEARWFTKLSILHQVWPSRRVLRERSVIDHLPSKLNCKVLILHGEKDRRTPLRQAEQLAAALQERGASVQTRYFPDANHKLGQRAYTEVVEFLRENLVPIDSASG